MQSENRFFEDLAKVVNGAVGTMAGVGREAEAQLRERVREFVGGADAVRADELEAVKAMAAAARDEVEALTARVTALEAALAKAEGGARKKPGKAPSANIDEPGSPEPIL